MRCELHDRSAVADAGRPRCGRSFGARMEQADAARRSRVSQDVRRRSSPRSREAARPRS